MRSDQDQLTEIEGAILSEIEHRGNTTAFKVRRAFQVSASIEWSGSAGSIYPAINRMVKKGLLIADATGDARATKKLSLTKFGRRALDEWSIAADRATSVGIDPFRLRAGIWMTFPAGKRSKICQNVKTVLQENIEFFEQEIETADEVEATRLQLNISLNKDRLAWIERVLAD